MKRVGLVGCGAIAQVHAAVLRSLPETRLCAVCDIRRDRAEQMAEADGCAVYEDYTEMLDREKPDAVHLCVPHFLHAPMAEEAAEQGIAVFTEKPPAISREQWERLRKAAEKAPIGVCFQNRYNRNAEAVREIIAANTYGAVTGARAFVTWHRDGAYYTDSGWRGKPETEGGGVLINQAIHTLDLLIWMLGRPETAEASLQNRHLAGVISVEDTAEIYLRIGGRPVLLYASNAYSADAPVIIEFQAERAALRLEGNGLDIITPAGTEHRTFEMPDALGKGYWGNGHLLCIRDFYQSLAENRSFRNRVEAVADTAETMLRIYEAGAPALSVMTAWKAYRK